ncbi:hypothetical protein [Devosia beringensis]|uniref:hypothetical protein n=1 Tax=Devosia beringensis TaxID=2657486 RepID=UPI00186B8D85|nr:hypothetical protein [Devosia beringensis]
MTAHLTKVLSTCIVELLFQLDNASEEQVNSDFSLGLMEYVGAELQGLDDLDAGQFIAAINEIAGAGTGDARRHFVENFPDNFGLSNTLA